MGAKAIGHLPHGTKVVIKTTPKAWGYSSRSLDDRVYFDPKKYYYGYVDDADGLWVQVLHPEGGSTTMGDNIVILPHYEVDLCIKYVGDKK